MSTGASSMGPSSEPAAALMLLGRTLAALGYAPDHRKTLIPLRTVPRIYILTTFSFDGAHLE